MITNILLYEIKLKQNTPFLFFFKKKNNISFQLHYRVDEDRFWFSKYEGNKLCNEHHTKNNIHKSLEIVEGISRRVIFLKGACDYKYEIFDLRKENDTLFSMIANVGKNIEQLHDIIENKKYQLNGMFLKGE